MKIIEPSVELMRDFDGAEVMKFLEKCGRTAYKSENNITEGSAEKFIRNIIKRGHESVLEHFSVTFKIICDRGVSHELVRHRLASFTQESTRYCVAGNTKLTFSNPHIKWTIKDLYKNVQNSKNGAWKRLLIRQLNEDTGVLEFAKIRNVFNNGVRKVYELKTELGYSLQCTEDHKIYARNGYLPLSALKKGDKIYVNGNKVNGEPLYKNHDWLYYQNITLNKTFVAISSEFGYSISVLKDWARRFKLPKKGTGYFNVGRTPWNKGMTEHDDPRVMKMVNSIRKYHCNGRHDGEKIILKENTTEYQKYAKNTCTICGTKKGLQVHHKDENRDNNCPYNLITLCASCHQRVHTKNLEILFADTITSIKCVGNEEVFDIEMDSSFHNFVANGVVVHNCNYASAKFGGELTFIKPCFWNFSSGSFEDEFNFGEWFDTMKEIEKYYKYFRKDLKVPPEQARSILPNSLKTEIVMTANLREFRHFLELRMTKNTHPQMRQIAFMILEVLKEKLPVIFEDISA